MPAGSESSYAPGGQCVVLLPTAQGLKYCGVNIQIIGHVSVFLPAL